MNVKPLGERILVKKIQKEQKTAGGLLLPESAIEDSNPIGHVIAVGADCREIKPCDLVLYLKFSGYQYQEDLFIIKESEILGILSD